VAAYEVLLLNTAIPQIQAAQTGDTYVVPRAIAFNSGVNVVNNDVTIYGLTVGRGAGAVATNTAVGASALAANTSGSFNVAVGADAAKNATSLSNAAVVGMNAVGSGVATGTYITAVGTSAMQNLTSGSYSVGVGTLALRSNTSGSYNTAVGAEALQANLSASNNTAVGYQAGYTNQTGASNSLFGQNAGYTNQTGSSNTIIGRDAGSSLTTSSNTLIGAGAGSDISSGSKNTILGRYNGNQGGLDIRTATGYVVLSDGDGNPREYISNLGTAVFTVDRTSSTNATSILLRDNVTGSQTNGVYKSIRSESNAGSSVSEIRFIETDGSNNNTAIAFATADTAGGLSEKVRVLNTGAILAFSGATTNATGTGVGFPSTQSASTDPNVLDDYEEGTWTPSLVGASTAGTFTYSARDAKYTKIGNMVTLFCAITVDTVSGSPTGSLQITGLPFAVAAGTSASGAGQFSLLGQASIQGAGFSTRGSTSVLYIQYVDGSNVSQVIQATAVVSGSIIDFTISYPAA
jgi:hypothetical protein